MQAIADAGGRPGLLVSAVGAPAPLPATPAPHRVAVRVALGGVAVDEAVFRLKTQLVDVRSAAPQALVGIITTTGDWQTLVDRDIGSYVDFHSVEAERPLAPPVPPAAFAGASPLTITPAAGKADVARWIVALPADAVRARDTLGDVARSGPIVPAGLVPGGMVDVRCAGRRLATYLDAQSLATVAIVPPSCAPVTISPEVPGTVRVALSSGETIVRVPSAEGHFAEGVRVDARQALTVREIIARHQAAAARQRRAVQQLISTGTMTLTFEAPSFPAPMAITSQATIYTAADATDIEQRDIRVNGIAFAGGRVPRLPLIEPERVASPPLAIALTDVYNYRSRARPLPAASAVTPWAFRRSTPGVRCSRAPPGSRWTASQWSRCRRCRRRCAGRSSRRSRPTNSAPTPRATGCWRARRCVSSTKGPASARRFIAWSPSIART